MEQKEDEMNYWMNSIIPFAEDHAGAPIGRDECADDGADGAQRPGVALG